MNPPKVICFGEVLWDCLPAGLFPGGAPMNAAYHLQKLGCTSIVASAVGDDFLGQEITRRLDSWKVDTSHIAVHGNLPTGVVQAEIDASGNASYTIVEGVAWDHIPATEALQQAASTADAFVFGSLAQRSGENRQSLQNLLGLLPKEALAVFDANLRPPFDDLALVRSLCKQATLIKLNHEEIARLTGGQPKEPEANARRLAEQTGKWICVTAGEQGAGLLRGGNWTWEPAQSVKVEDTVGAGDSFLAACVEGLLTKRTDAECLKRASRLAEFVAGSRGPTPHYNDNIKQTLHL